MSIVNRIDVSTVINLTPAEGITANGASAALTNESVFTTIQAILTTTDGAGTADVNIEASNDGINWCSTPLATIALAGVLADSDGFAIQGAWRYYRAVVSNLTGIGARVDVLCCY